jgi:hypothetical protein
MSEFSDNAKEWLEFWGDCNPTVRVEDKTLKGYTTDYDGTSSFYVSAYELREMAAACFEVADWLEARADAHLADAAPEA